MIKPNAIILSAGRSSRMGRHKALLKINGHTFLENLTQTFATVCENIYIIVSKNLTSELNYLNLQLPKSQIVINPWPENGRMSSVLTGLKANGLNPVFLHNVDTPLISTNTLITLLKNYDDKKTLIPRYSGKTGHPILLGRSIIEFLLKQNIENNLRNLIYSRDYEFVTVNDPAILLNINTNDDYINLTNKKMK